MHVIGFLGVALLTIPQSAPPTCGWEYAGDTGQPESLAAVIAQLPDEWYGEEYVLTRITRWWRDCDATAAREAIFTLRRALRRDANSPALQALLGMLLVRGPEVLPAPFAGPLPPISRLSNSEREGARLLASAAETPDLALHATADLAFIALRTRAPETLALARATLDRLLAQRRSPQLAAHAAQLALATGEYADAAARAAQALDDGVRAAARIAGVANLLLGRDTMGTRLYLAGMQEPDAQRAYLEDLAYLLEPRDTATWSKLDAAGRAAWLKRQWEWRASTSGRTLADRLHVHFVRLAHALSHYPRTASSIVPGVNAVTFDGWRYRLPIDDRGLVYVRHGAPDRVITVPFVAKDNSRIAWGYASLGGRPQLFEFTMKDCGKADHAGAKSVLLECANQGDYYLTVPLECFNLQKYSQAAAAATYFDYGHDVHAFDPRLASYLRFCYQRRGSALDGAFQGELRFLEVRRRSVADGLLALRSEHAQPELAQPLRIAVSSYAMREGSGTHVFVASAIPAAELAGDRLTGNHALRVRLSVEDAAALRVESVDTVLPFRLPPGRRDRERAAVRLTTGMPATPTEEATVRVAITNVHERAQGQIVTLARAVPDYAADRFGMSDLVIAEPRDGSWQRGDVRLQPIPGHFIGEGEVFRLYYELYGAQEDELLDVRIVIAPAGETSLLDRLRELIRSRAALEVRFQERAAPDGSGTVRLRRDIGAELEPGTYQVSVEASNGAGQTVRTSTVLAVVE